VKCNGRSETEKDSGKTPRRKKPKRTVAHTEEENLVQGDKQQMKKQKGRVRKEWGPEEPGPEKVGKNPHSIGRTAGDARLLKFHSTAVMGGRGRSFWRSSDRERKESQRTKEA